MEKRKGSDRRKIDLGPPKGCFERRKKPERRLHVPEEAELSDEDFVKLFGGAAMASIRVATPLAVEQAAEVLDRVRDRF